MELKDKVCYTISILISVVCTALRVSSLALPDRFFPSLQIYGKSGLATRYILKGELVHIENHTIVPVNSYTRALPMHSVSAKLTGLLF